MGGSRLAHWTKASLKGTSIATVLLTMVGLQRSLTAPARRVSISKGRANGAYGRKEGWWWCAIFLLDLFSACMMCSLTAIAPRLTSEQSVYDSPGPFHISLQ